MAIIMTVAMLALLAVTALAIDVNHMYMNRTKLQNGVDAAALAAAVILDNSGSQAIGMEISQDNATAAVKDTLNKLVGAEGNAELDIASASVSVTYNNHSTFDGDICTTGGDCYVRVAVNNLDLQSFFLQLFTDTKRIAASAVAGPSAGAGVVCNLAPLTVCTNDPDSQHGGFVDGEQYPIKVASTSEDIGPGNFQLVDFDDELEGSSQDEKNDHLREQLAGGYVGCSSLGGTIITKPGNTVGSVAQGLNTRFGDFSNALKGEYKSDLNITEDITHSDYTAGEHNNRRMLVIPMIDCENPVTNANGKSEFPVSSLGCFFMVNKAPKSNSGKQDVTGEYVSECSVDNSFNHGQSSRNGPYRIVLYKDPFNEDS
ncbi:pilus assembly protein TadG-related protein [Vibrio sp. DNB22_19_2]